MEYDSQEHWVEGTMLHSVYSLNGETVGQRSVDINSMVIKD